jgi:D-alanine-D-alanine ligase
MLTVAVLYGGRSGEHEVSRCSGASVFSRLDRSRYNVIAVAIDKDGRWYVQKDASIIDDKDFGHILEIKREGRWYVNHYDQNGTMNFFNADNGELVSADVIFPVLHGTFCEDGTLQGLLELAMVPYVGAGVLGSAVGMDKDVAKRLLKDAGIPVVPWITVTKRDLETSFDFITQQLEIEIGYPCFIKPANAGSSVGISKVKSLEELPLALGEAFKFDSKILIEKSIDCREIECSVLGNELPVASVLGEVVPTHEFYSYEAKYIDANGAKLFIPAMNIPESLAGEIRECAVSAFSALCLDGLSRVDFFLDKKTGEFYLNEVNTLPGFTSISMYPKLWEHTGLPYEKLLDRLIELALERNKTRRAIVTDIR